MNRFDGLNLIKSASNNSLTSYILQQRYLNTSIVFMVSFFSSLVSDLRAVRSAKRSESSTGRRFSRPDFLQNLHTQSLPDVVNSIVDE